MISVVECVNFVDGVAMKKQEIAEWLDWILLTSIPLRRFAPDDSPVGIASGCLVKHRGRRFILTVAHAVKRGVPEWAIEIGFNERHGTEIFRPSRFIYLGEIKRGTAKMQDVDYCYAEVPSDVNPTFQLRTPRGAISEMVHRHVFDDSAIAEPDSSETYGFSGQVYPELHGTHAVVTQPTVYPGLRYTRSEGPFHEFALPVQHPGHEAFRGCSGAPIVDTHRRPVALVSNGDDEKNVIYGVSLSRYRFALDFYCNEIRPA